MYKNLKTCCFILLVLLGFSCSKKQNISKSLVTEKVIRDTLVKPLIRDTVSLNLFHNVFYKVLKKIYPNKFVNPIIYNDEISFSVDSDNFIIPNDFIFKLGKFFNYSNSDANNYILFEVVNMENNLVFFFKKEKNRNFISDSSIKITTITSFQNHDFEKSKDYRQKNNKKFYVLIFRKIEKDYILYR